MKTHNTDGVHQIDVTRGRKSTNRAGSLGIDVLDSGTEVSPVTTLQFLGATVTDGDDGVAIVTIGQTGVLVPEATVTAEKSTANPTFNFDFIPEGAIHKIAGTYWVSGQTNWGAGTNACGLASATDRDGPWTVYGSNPILTVGSQTWETAIADVNMNAPEIMTDGTTFYLFYAAEDAVAGTYGAIGVATASAITGPYTKYGSNPILTPGGGAAWDSRRVCEPSVWLHGGTWYMAYMGETTATGWGLSEKVGFATAPSAFGPWTKTAGNPLIDHGANTEWDDDLTADPYLFRVGSLWWCLYSGGGSVGGTGTRKWHLGLASANAIEGPWTKHPDNPILSASSSGWDEMAAWRGSIYEEGGTYTGVYGGLNSALSAAKGGNFTLDVNSSAIPAPPDASDIDITDTGGYYTSTDVEGALQEIGVDLAAIAAGGAGHYEVIVSGTAPPVAVTNEAEDDWLYGFVAD